MKIRLKSLYLLGLLALGLTVLTPLAQGQRSRRRRPRAGRDSADFQANRLLKQAEDYLDTEYERGLKMLQTIITQFPTNFVRYKAYLSMGKHHVKVHEAQNAIRALNHLKELKKSGEELKDEALEVYLEGMYLMGVAYYDARQYSAAFPVLRKITRDYPNTVWANQAFYYIGMCHFRTENWNKAIEALSLVGTFVNTSDKSLQYMEAGHRFYVKIEDGDLPVVRRLGRAVKVEIRTRNGDSEVVTCIALNRKADIFLGSIPTRVGSVTPRQIGDGTLQVLGGDEITSTYIDENTFKGERNIDRRIRTQVVSTGQVNFTLATFEGKAPAGFLGQPAFVTVKDADMDSTPEADKLRIKIIARYKKEVEEHEDVSSIMGVDIEKLLAEDKKKERWVTRDEVELELTEQAEARTSKTGRSATRKSKKRRSRARARAIRTGRFGGKVMLKEAITGEDIDTTDQVLICKLGDEVIATYVDSLHVQGTFDRTMTAKLQVAGYIQEYAKAMTTVVNEPLLKTKKNLVEGMAFFELGKIFRDMGLREGAGEKCEEGLGRLNEIIAIKEPLPREKIEEAYQLKWRTEMVMSDYGAAIRTCREFNRKYPDSPLVDAALKEVGMIHMEKGNYRQAKEIFRQILNLANSQIRPEAQFRLAECQEKEKDLSSAIPAYQVCAERYPDSEFAGAALAKQVDHYFKAKDYVTANELLENIFSEHQDADFLDSMLIKWVLVAYKMGDFHKAYEKCSELVFEHPDSRFARKAQQILPKIERKIKAKQKPSEEGEESAGG